MGQLVDELIVMIALGDNHPAVGTSDVPVPALAAPASHPD